MTEHPAHQDRAHRVHAILTAGYAAFVEDLAANLDLAAGVADATQSIHFARFATDLFHTLDLGTGLAAITGSSPPSAQAVPIQPAQQSAPYLDQGASWARRLVHQLASLDVSTRLALRGRSDWHALRRSIARARDLDLARDQPLDLDLTHAIADDLDRNFTLSRALNLIRDLDLALELALDLARDRDPDRDHSGDHARTRDLDHILEHAIDVARAFVRTFDAAHARAHTRLRVRGNARARAVDLARERERERDRDHARVLALSLARAVDLAHDIAGDLARDRASDHARDHARSLVRSLARVRDLTFAVALDHARDHACDLIDDLIYQLNLADPGAARAADAQQLRSVLDVLDRVTDDFVGVDLSAVSLADAELVGIRWSRTTRWPSGWEDVIRARSIEIAPTMGIFEIVQPGGALVDPSCVDA